MRRDGCGFLCEGNAGGSRGSARVDCPSMRVDGSTGLDCVGGTGEEYAAIYRGPHGPRVETYFALTPRAIEPGVYLALRLYVVLSFCKSHAALTGTVLKAKPAFVDQALGFIHLNLAFQSYRPKGPSILLSPEPVSAS